MHRWGGREVWVRENVCGYEVCACGYEKCWYKKCVSGCKKWVYGPRQGGPPISLPALMMRLCLSSSRDGRLSSCRVTTTTRATKSQTWTLNNYI